MNKSQYFKNIEQLVADTIGLEISSLGEKTIHRSIENHFKENNQNNINEYYNELLINSKLLQSLIEKIIVPETWFFRDTSPFLFLKEYLEKNKDSILQKNKIKALSVPCSTGEEPYSLAMIFLELGLLPTQFHIDALDISENAINLAKNGIYFQSSIRENIDIIYKYLHKNDNNFQIDKKLQNNVKFYIGNILSPSNQLLNESYNIILCRNLLIYLNDKARDNLLNILKQLLSPEGILIVGHSETHILHTYGFKPINYPKSFAFRKADIEPSKLELKKNNRSSTDRKLPLIKKNIIADNTKKIATQINSNIKTETKETDTKNELTISNIKHIADSGDLKTAFTLCNEYIKNYPIDADAYYLYGLINQAMNNINIAIENYEKALYLNPQHYETLIVLSLLLENTGNLEKANLLKERVKRFQGIENE